MRVFIAAAFGLALAWPVAIAAPARADTDNFANQAQHFLKQWNGQGDRDAYERGRDDEMRRQHAEQDRDRERQLSSREQWRDHDQDRDGRRNDQGYRPDAYRPDRD